ncbi:MAG: imidazolonepropionase [Bacteroidetes bacterium RIFCSPLOWO2_02_FULL_36_8]|nr:MAG: imidazolonepropionase [Bacteroidetes bacterium RIFCSPLOWO2_02_FULL_36_8]OFY72236.1 MAG: imidazolonepropionase [Bacteroidetes bacterium RIFCSPLOWO2_12_FULL_37_12]
MPKSLLITNIKILTGIDETGRRKVSGAEMKILQSIENAFLHIHEGKIFSYGKMEECPSLECDTYDASGRFVMPCWVDSHTHLVYAESREKEFVDRINGLSYVQIAERGGGILNSAKRLQQTSEDELFQTALIRLKEIVAGGTGDLEIKSGYGLTVNDELKMLRVIKRLQDENIIPIKSTFLGAHAIPKEYSDRKKYVDLLIYEMLPKIAEEKLAVFIDVFCDKGFFTVEETERILMAGKEYGLIPKIHANELDFSGGIQVGIKCNALSVDHLEFTGEEEINLLKNSETMPTLLPSTAFFLGLKYPPARKMIDAGLPVALASDYNPGSSPSGNMCLVLSLACIKMKMLPEEAINAATLNGAYALGMEKTHGSISKGKMGSVIITKKIPSLAFLPYSFGNSLVEEVIVEGGKMRNRKDT